MKPKLLLALAFLTAQNAGAQSAADTTRDLAAMRAELAQMRADMEIVKGQLAQVIRMLNQRAPQGRVASAPTAGPVRTSVGEAPTLGRADAPVTIVEFSDYQCPFCQRFFATTLSTIRREYVDAGKVRYVFRDNPLDQLHPNARKAAEAAHCAGDQGKYWEMHDTLFTTKALTLAQLAEHAQSIGLDEAKFRECLTSGRHAARIDRSLAEGAAAGVQGTPGFVIGKTKSGDVVEGTPIRGAQSLETFRKIIDQMLTQP